MLITYDNEFLGDCTRRDIQREEPRRPRSRAFSPFSSLSCRFSLDFYPRPELAQVSPDAAAT